MKVECCYCHRNMGEKMGPDNLVSHGICSACIPRAEREAGLMPVSCIECGMDLHDEENDICADCLDRLERELNKPLPFRSIRTRTWRAGIDPLPV